MLSVSVVVGSICVLFVLGRVRDGVVWRAVRCCGVCVQEDVVCGVDDHGGCVQCLVVVVKAQVCVLYMSVCVVCVCLGVSDCVWVSVCVSVCSKTSNLLWTGEKTCFILI